MNSKDFWDEKALDFPRYDETNEQFQQHLISQLKQRGVLKRETKVLDIGCGTGVYTLPLAKEVAHITALDISSQMLQYLKEDAWFHNLSKQVTTVHSTWQDFTSENNYDVVFASLSAAFSTPSDYDKLLNVTKKHGVFLDFVKTKGSNFEKQLLHHHNLEEVVFEDNQNLKRWLKNNNINYETIPLAYNYTKELEVSTAIEKVKEIIKNRLQLSEDAILTLLKPLQRGKCIYHEMNMHLELTIWEVPH